MKIPNDIEKLTTTIARPWLCEIIAGRKKIEYRELKPYWTKKLATVKAPFLLRMINGMQKKAPEVTVLIKRVTTSKQYRECRLHIGRVVDYKYWDRKRERRAKRS